MNKFFNGSIVAALIALSTVACASGPKVKVTYIPRSHANQILTVSEDQIFINNEKVSRVRLVEVPCKGDTGTNTWLPAGHETETTPSTEDDAIAWMIANTSPGSANTTITVQEACSSITNVAAAGEVLPHPIDPAIVATNNQR